MSGVGLSVVRATLLYAVPAWAASFVIAISVGLDPWGLFTASLPTALFWAPQAVAAYRVRSALERFAMGVPGRPEASTSVFGPMHLTWSALDLEVEGRRTNFDVGRLIVRIGDEAYAYISAPEGVADLGRRAALHAQAGTSPGDLL